jgi:hypothetical protein
MSIEHGMHCADRGQPDIAVLAADLFADLRSAPARMITLDLKNQVLDLEGQLATLPVGAATAISQPFKTCTPVSIEDFVAGFARDIELAAQRRHLFAFHQPSNKPQPFVHFGTLLPRHLRTPRKCRKVLPMWSEFV